MLERYLQLFCVSVDNLTVYSPHTKYCLHKYTIKVNGSYVQEPTGTVSMRTKYTCMKHKRTVIIAVITSINIED